jgi:nondiscriminating aspartyl-tRNA synthetase
MAQEPRILISETVSHIGKTVRINGWVVSRRDHGKIAFIDVRDRTGILQTVGVKLTETVSMFDVVQILGVVKERPVHMVNANLATGSVELEIASLHILNHATELPFDMGGQNLDVSLPTLLDYRSLTVRHPKVQAIFRVQAAIANAFRKAAGELGATEVFPPTVSASSTEGGAEVLKVDYFGHPAFLVQSPQLYKQMLVGMFERVFIITHIYRAEPSVTTRHLVESIQMDCEVGFIDSFDQLTGYMEQTFAKTIDYAQTAAASDLALLGVEPSKVTNPIPRVTMREAQQIIFERTGVDHRDEKDLMPEDEREICKWALEEHQSDLVTITHFPTKKRAFYTKPDPANPEYSLSYDLLYKGLEICSGAQRIDDVDELTRVIAERGMDPKDFEMYLQAFRYGMPPHGGFSYGLERTTMKLLDLANIREASLYPRDMERVDFRLGKMD